MKESVGPSLGAQRAMLGEEPDISWKEGRKGKECFSIPRLCKTGSNLGSMLEKNVGIQYTI